MVLPSLPVGKKKQKKIINDDVVKLGKNLIFFSGEKRKKKGLWGGVTIESPGMTLAAPSNFSFRRVATSRKRGSLRQQVRNVHEPDKPWHLHSVRMKFLTAFVIVISYRISESAN